MIEMFEDKLGITVDTVNTNTYSDMGSPFTSLKPVETAYVTKMVERIYDDFVNKVSEGRSMTYAQVDSIGQGRVWSGTDALEIGLIDEIGGLERAIKVASELVELETYKIYELAEEKAPFESLMSHFTQNMETRMAKKYFGSHYNQFNSVYKNITEEGIFMRMPFNLIIQ